MRRREPGVSVLGACSLVATAAMIPPAAMGESSQASATKPPAGKVMFVAACGGCHTLKAAGTRGKKGPNLADESSSYSDLVDRIKHGGEGMPAFDRTLTIPQIRSIASFVVRSMPSPGAAVDD